jgi:hypothetical protein
MRKGYLILCSDRMPDDYLVDIVEFVPVFIEIGEITVQRLEFGAARNGNVQSFSGEETLKIKEIVIVFVNNI